MNIDDLLLINNDYLYILKIIMHCVLSIKKLKLLFKYSYDLYLITCKHCLHMLTSNSKIIFVENIDL